MQKYYLKLKANAPQKRDSFLKLPKVYYIEQNPFIYSTLLKLLAPECEEEIDGDDVKRIKVPSIITVFSIWSCMNGTGVLSLPWSIKQAGIIPSIFITFIYGVISYYTCYIYIKTGLKSKDFSDTVAKYFGRNYGFYGRSLQIMSSIIMNLGALFIFLLIISQNLYDLLAFIIVKLGFNLDVSLGQKPVFNSFSIFYAGVILSILLFPLLIRKDISFLIKMNSFGVYFVMILICFIFYITIKSLINTTYDFESIYNTNDSEVKHLLLFGDDPFKFCGTVTLSFISHTFIFPIMRSNKNQENNNRDLALGYFLAGLTYIVVGVLGYIGFSGKDYDSDFKDVSFNN